MKYENHTIGWLVFPGRIGQNGVVKNRLRIVIVLGALAALLTPFDASAQGRRGGGKMGGMGGGVTEEGGEAPERSPLGRFATREQQEQSGLFFTGLKPIYPSSAKCPEVASSFGAQTRYDGSSRRGDANHGYHNGIDISCPEGTPLLAFADGTMILKFSGGQLVGNRIMFRHAPADTGLDGWIYTYYQHLTELPALEVGARVKIGQVVGRCGRTGTVGGHYGASGYPHLHFGAFVGDSDDYEDRRMMAFPAGGRHLDPLAIFAAKGLDNHRLASLPDSEKSFAVPYATADGKITPAGTRVVWPFACAAR